MNLQIKGTGFEVTEEIKNYIMRKMEGIGRMIDGVGGDNFVSFEVGFDNRRHKSGEIYRAECNCVYNGKKIRAVSTKEDAYSAIDDVRDEVERQITEAKDRRVGLFRRGARSVKKMLKGISNRNPFTSK